MPGIALRPATIETNIVLADVTETGISPSDLVGLLDAAGVRVMDLDTSRIRFVTHRLIGDEDVDRAAAIVAEVVERNAVPPPELPDLAWVEALEAADWEEDEAERPTERRSDAEELE